MLQILAPEEINPDLTGNLRIVDDEDGVSVEVTITRRTLRAYVDRLNAYTREVASFCHGHGVSFVQLQSDISVEEAVLHVLRRAQTVV